jgi:hypothetical protein
VEDSIAEVFAPKPMSKVDKNVDENENDAVVNVDENVEKDAVVNVDENIEKEC